MWGLLLCALIVACGCSQLASRRVSAGPSIADDKVLFRYYAPTARRVQLAGNWTGNNWARGDGSVGEANVGLMEDADGDGVWEIGVALPPGRYYYLFWIDENIWRIDPGNPEEVSEGPNGIASQIVVYREDGKLTLR